MMTLSEIIADSSMMAKGRAGSGLPKPSGQTALTSGNDRD
jgi:hypothetical protein